MVNKKRPRQQTRPAAASVNICIQPVHKAALQQTSKPPIASYKRNTHRTNSCPCNLVNPPRPTRVALPPSSPQLKKGCHRKKPFASRYVHTSRTSWLPSTGVVISNRIVYSRHGTSGTLPAYLWGGPFPFPSPPALSPSHGRIATVATSPAAGACWTDQN